MRNLVNVLAHTLLDFTGKSGPGSCWSEWTIFNIPAERICSVVAYLQLLKTDWVFRLSTLNRYSLENLSVPKYLLKQSPN